MTIPAKPTIQPSIKPDRSNVVERPSILIGIPPAKMPMAPAPSRPVEQPKK